MHVLSKYLEIFVLEYMGRGRGLCCSRTSSRMGLRGQRSREIGLHGGSLWHNDGGKVQEDPIESTRWRSTVAAFSALKISSKGPVSPLNGPARCPAS